MSGLHGPSKSKSRSYAKMERSERYEMKTNTMITVDISKTIATKVPPTDFIVLFNPTVDRINDLHRSEPNTFIFSFATGKPEDVANMNGLIESDYILQPFFMGNVDPCDWPKVVQYFIDQVWTPMPKLGRPRIENRDKTLKATKPWAALGMSRSTWYARQAEQKVRS